MKEESIESLRKEIIAPDREDFLRNLNIKIKEYNFRIDQMEGQNLDEEELRSYLSSECKYSIAVELKKHGLVDYQAMKESMMEIQKDEFNPEVFDKAWDVISDYASGRSDRLVGGTGF